MTTKAQEREALEKIKKLVASLGENSYLGSAFDGAFELAERNIDDDAAYSARYYIDRSNELESGNYAAKATLNDELSACKDERANAQRRVEYLQNRVDSLQESAASLIERNANIASTIEEMAMAAEKRDAEIMVLKAKLYDMITA